MRHHRVAMAAHSVRARAARRGDCMHVGRPVQGEVSARALRRVSGGAGAPHVRDPRHHGDGRVHRAAATSGEPRPRGVLPRNPEPAARRAPLPTTRGRGASSEPLVDGVGAGRRGQELRGAAGGSSICGAAHASGRAARLAGGGPANRRRRRRHLSLDVHRQQGAGGGQGGPGLAARAGRDQHPTGERRLGGADEFVSLVSGQRGHACGVRARAGCGPPPAQPQDARHGISNRGAKNSAGPALRRSQQDPGGEAARDRGDACRLQKRHQSRHGLGVEGLGLGGRQRHAVVRLEGLGPRGGASGRRGDDGVAAQLHI
mmetsp:Transcript_9720/g.18307  ORF Transcript_9720/g.18307 Transcript_9720/m.18307 type:complete len:316 (-) Transcript_9720:2168-3115(-)